MTKEQWWEEIKRMVVEKEGESKEAMESDSDRRAYHEGSYQAYKQIIDKMEQQVWDYRFKVNTDKWIYPFAIRMLMKIGKDFYDEPQDLIGYLEEIDEYDDDKRNLVYKYWEQLFEMKGTKAAVSDEALKRILSMVAYGYTWENL